MIYSVLLLQMAEHKPKIARCSFPCWSYSLLTEIDVDPLISAKIPDLYCIFMEWFGLEGTYRSSSSNPPAMGRDTFH